MRQRHLWLAALLALPALLYFCTPGGSPEQGQTGALSGKQPVARYEIDSLTATSEKNLWLAERDTIINALDDRDSTFIVEGFRIHRADLEGMLRALRDTTHSYHDSIWAMLGLRNDTVTLIFQTRDRATGKEVYYDFTQPCPPMCPE